jgi:hypothetical protein
VRNEMEYELNRYDVYKSHAQLFLHQGLAKEARLFESLADLCFEKAELLRKVEEILDAWVKTESPKKGPDSASVG